MESLEDREKSTKSRTWWFFVVSFGLHFLLLGFLSLREYFNLRNTPEEIKLDLVELSPEDLKRIRSQIVETSKVQKSEKAADNAYLGEQTQVVEKQTKADVAAPFRDAKGNPSSPSKASKQPKVKLADLGVKMNLKPLGNIEPNTATTVNVGAATSDYLKDVKSGAQTMLNTKEFLYFSFFQRVRRQLEQFWEPNLREKLKKMFDRGRTLANDREHSTRLLVILDSSGTITHIKVHGTSGIQDLDQAAIDAFNRAGPFPNPPKGLVDKDGTVTVEWEFILKT